VQDPPQSRVGAVLHHLADELDPEASAPLLGEDVDVCEVDVRDAVRRRPAEADLAAVEVADDALRLAAQEDSSAG
jgi:hypothetical protein